MSATCPYPEPSRSSPYPTSHFLKIHFNIILPSKTAYPKWFVPSGFPTKTQYKPLLFPIPRYMPRPFHSSRFYHPNNVEYRSLSSSLCSFLHSLVTSSLLGQNILFNNLLTNTITLRSSRNVSDQVSHSYKATDSIIVLYILIFYFWIANWKTKDSAPNDSKHSLTSVCS